MNKFCSNCGHPVKNTDKVCGNCGTPLTPVEQINQSTKNRGSMRQPAKQASKKNHSAYKWFIGIGVVALLAEGGYLVYQNMDNSNNSAVMETKNSSSVTSSDSAQSINAGSSSNQEDAASDNNEDDGDGATVANIGPKTLASSVLLLGGKKSEGWKSFATQDSLEVNVIQASAENENYSEPGTGVSYMFTSDGQNGGEILEYRISSDGSTVYCYEQSSKDSATRHVTPFATLSAKEIQQVKDSDEVKNLVDKMEVKS
ncbi:zinc ribbon domain-containing protein [Lactobacillus sp. PV037]|uniref:zinc ribbon domain-containing protein n=1 Tax=unclassified Lactobacillus TaxID=2620435 RepID=UPI0022408EBE|nr:MULTISPECIES: zinc ribbon domain-containing protein [unclassified Lactobacillus]QNQ82325.1 zinc ribbon domain-containing protein [Lactobacillus sp. PV012]QNQ83563.1 zinc ribbon domain-containing protein [Lactobacillus sp. PV037]